MMNQMFSHIDLESQGKRKEKKNKRKRGVVEEEEDTRTYLLCLKLFSPTGSFASSSLDSSQSL